MIRNKYYEYCLILSTLVYNDIEYIKNLNCKETQVFKKKCIEFNNDNLFNIIPIKKTYIAYKIIDNILFISIAGTITNNQLVKHINVILLRIDELDDYCDDDYYYHKNFLNEFRIIKDEYFKLLELKKNKKIIISGHSVGGSIGQLCALLTKLKYPNRIVKFISFGSPYGCSKKTSDLVNNTLDECIQFNHKNDFIPKLSLKCLFGRAGKRIILNKEFKNTNSSYYYYHKLESYFNCIISDNQDTNE